MGGAAALSPCPLGLRAIDRLQAPGGGNAVRIGNRPRAIGRPFAPRLPSVLATPPAHRKRIATGAEVDLEPPIVIHG